ncbi:unnamed protein product [Strongylus vulgaris]|uniref:Large ribosomal subunit protein eL28 n=1 Tax=Strongylus vulgaris TaxID=40348 RepID=A0A3P7J9R2_STRVU|nr:unnamed protein product [Strongylus vulgaris]
MSWPDRHVNEPLKAKFQQTSVSGIFERERVMPLNNLVIMSADLTWQIIRKNSCFIRRQKGIQKHFSVEPFNLRGLNSRRFNGLISKKAMDIAPAKDGKGVVVSVKVPEQTCRCFLDLCTTKKLLDLLQCVVFAPSSLPSFEQIFCSKAGRPAKSINTISLRNRDKMLRSVKAIAKSQGLTPYYKLAQRRAAAIVRSQQPKTKKHAKKIEA